MGEAKKGNNRKKEWTRQEIISRLKWFHGEDFSKYPLREDF